MPLTNSPGYQPPPDQTAPKPPPRRVLSLVRLIILCLAVVTILLGVLDFTLPTYGNVNGAVRDLDGHPLRVEVSVAGVADAIQTDANGRFTLAQIRSGTQILNIRYQGSDIHFQIDVPTTGSLNIGQIQIDTAS